MQVFLAVWRKAPPTLRKTIIAVIGGTIVLLGLALIVLPGPFTLPLLILGFAILGSEFAWAVTALHKIKQGMAKGAELTKAGLRKGAEVGRATARGSTAVGRAATRAARRRPRR
jgi:hypothetical protein